MFTLHWNGSDPENEILSYDIYLHERETYVASFREEALFFSGYDKDRLNITDLEQGKNYFWTVIPYDGCTYGRCLSGVQSFRVNYKPLFKEIEDQEVSAGESFKLKITATDEDPEDSTNIRYYLIDAPEGMSINEETGMIRWTPNDDQVMLHTIKVETTDGMESTSASFKIDVKEADSKSSAFLIMIVLGIVLGIIVILIAILLLRKKKQMDREAEEEGERVKDQILHEHDEEQLSYEQLYGIPAPEEEEGMTTRELKDYIHERIEDLES
jgi:hypothetical protein